MTYCPQCQQSFSTTHRFCPDDGTRLQSRDPYKLAGTTQAGKYRIVELAGLGGLGAVYRAEQVGIDRQVAFKILQPNITSELTINLFEREARIAGRLNHVNIATVHDCGRTQESISYLVMEWLEGITLEDEIANSAPLSLERTNDLLRQIAAALDAAHAAKVIHRDLKPSNIMLIKDSHGRELLKVVDFGIGKVLSDAASTGVSSLVGTPHYASPEQLQPGASIDHRTDIYSLGVILFRLLTNVLPFDGASAQEIIQMHRVVSPPALRSFREDLSEEIAQLVNRMLAKPPKGRPDSVGEVYELFDRAVCGSQSRSQQPAVSTVTRPSGVVTFPRNRAAPAGVGYLYKKICVLGASAVGKTSLINRYVNGVFDAKYLTTVGVAISSKDVRLGDWRIRLTVWDVAGEDDFQRVSVSKLRGISGVLLVADGTRQETLAVALELKERLETEFDLLPLVLVINKADLSDKWEIGDRKVEELRAKSLRVLTGSALSGFGVEDAFSELAFQILEVSRPATS